MSGSVSTKINLNKKMACSCFPQDCTTASWFVIIDIVISFNIRPRSHHHQRQQLKQSFYASMLADLVACIWRGLKHLDRVDCKSQYRHHQIGCHNTAVVHLKQDPVLKVRCGSPLTNSHLRFCRNAYDSHPLLAGTPSLCKTFCSKASMYKKLPGQAANSSTGSSQMESFFDFVK